VAEFFKGAGVFPEAESIAASLPGKDILNTPGYAVEVKARRDFNPVEWSKQASKNAGTDVPVVVMRPDGMGEESVAKFLAFMTLDRFTWMVNRIQWLEHSNGELGSYVEDHMKLHGDDD
jgi:hypothetical protein